MEATPCILYSEISVLSFSLEKGEVPLAMKFKIYEQTLDVPWLTLFPVAIFA